MLNFQIVQTPFRFGLAEGIDPNHAPFGTLMTAENVEWKKGGRVQKRDGVTPYPTDILGGGNLSAGARLLVRGSELCVIDGTYLYSWSETASAWIRMDRVPDVGLTWKTTLDTHDGVSSSDIAYADGRIVQAWVVGDPLTIDTTSMLWVQIFDAETGANTLVSTPLSSQAHGVRVLYDGTQCFVVYATLATNIVSKRIDLSTFAVAAVGFLVNNKNSTSGWDALIVNGDIVLAYETSPNGFLELERFSYDSGTNTYTSIASDGITSEWGVNDDFRSIAIDGVEGEPLYVVYHSTNAGLTRIATANIATMAEITAPVTLEGSIESHNVTVRRIDASNVLAGWSAAVITPDRGRATTMKLSSTLVAATSSLRGSWGTRFASRVFTIGARLFAMLHDMPLSQSSVFNGVDTSLVEIETTDKGATDYVPHRFLGRLDVLIGGTSTKGFLPSGPAVSATTAKVAVPFLSAVPQLATSNWQCGLRLATVTIGADLPADMWRSVEYGGELYISAAPISVYDGRTVFDHVFPRSLVVGSTQAASPTAGSIASGTYLYAFTREYRSYAGVLHRSPVVTVSASAPGADSTITIVLASCGLTTKIDVGTGTDFPAIPVVVITHRSTVGSPNYYRLTFEPGFNTLRYDVESASQTFTDTRADTDIGGGLGVDLNARPLLYTTGGILEDEQPPCGLTLALHRSRLWLVTGDRRSIWFSKSFQDDIGVAPGFSTSFRIVTEEDITAIWSMDEKGIIAADRSLWYFLGEGPNAAGQGSDLQGPLRIQTDVGCTNPRSVVSMPDGTMFESSGRLYLLTRGLELVWLGREVQDQIASFPLITSAVLVSSKNQVRFTCNNAGATAHTVLVYDYVEKQWSTFRYVGGAVAVADAIMHDGEYHLLTTAGAVYRETSGANFLDDDEWVTLTLETAWYNAAGPTAFQAVRRFALHGESVSDHALSVWVGFNRNTTYQQGPETWAADSAVTDVGPLEAAEIHIGPRRKCSSIRFKVQDAAPSVIAGGAGSRFDTMGIEVGVKVGFDKKPATKRG